MFKRNWKKIGIILFICFILFTGIFLMTEVSYIANNLPNGSYDYTDQFNQMNTTLGRINHDLDNIDSQTFQTQLNTDNIN